MIDDAEKGLINEIYTRSFSRFGRNVHECLSYLRHLKAINVTVYFEKEKLNSKEEFVEDMLADNRKQLLESLQAGLQDRTKYSVEESKAIVRKMIMNTDSIYRNFSSEDEAALKKMYEKKGVPFADLEKEKHVIDFITSMMDGVKENLDYAVIANMMKIIVLSYEQKEMLHESGLERTIDAMVDLLIASIFEM